MSAQANFALRGRNPDILTCIANLSNDEVFTPPEFANRMLDSMADAWAVDHDGANIWTDRNVTFLDPCTKTGVFLREITRRLTVGLANDIPDLRSRVDHILTQQVFGIAITHLTGLLARRSLYCSKYANGEHSIAKSFEHPDGNIWFRRVEHTWCKTACMYCDAPKSTLDRDDKLENYAYPFIHTDNTKAFLCELFGDDMQFDVIIGNPPYQMKGGAGGTSDSSLYHRFVKQAITLEPKLLSMVSPSRWLAGGRGLTTFRQEMLSSGKIVKLVDFPVSREVFPNVEVKGGICYFLWSNGGSDKCEVTVVRGEAEEQSLRQLDEFEVFVRNPLAAGILRKVQHQQAQPIIELLTADTPFGVATNFAGFRSNKKPGDVSLHYVKKGKRAVGFVARQMITKNKDLIDKWKVLVPKAGSDGGQKIPDSVLGKPWISTPPSVATQTFLAFSVATEREARSIESYYRTKFFRHLVSLRKFTQDALRPMYLWVPAQRWDREWTDEELYKMYDLSAQEVDYVESVISSMPNCNSTDEQ